MFLMASSVSLLYGLLCGETVHANFPVFEISAEFQTLYSCKIDNRSLGDHSDVRLNQMYLSSEVEVTE